MQETSERRWPLLIKQQQRRFFVAPRVVRTDSPSALFERGSDHLFGLYGHQHAYGCLSVFNQILNAVHPLSKRRIS